MKQIILFLALLSISISVESQSFIAQTPTFIGKTQEEITSLNKGYGNKLISGETDTLFTDLIFADNKSIINYVFTFNNREICIAFAAETQDKTAGDSILKDIEKKCQEKLAEKARLQKIDGKNYIWNIQGNNEYYAFSTTESK